MKGKVAVGGLVLASAGVMAFLGFWESSGDRVLTVYADKLAQGLPTVCNGLTRHITRTPIIVGETWTTAKCEAEEAAAVAKVQASLLRCFRVTPPQEVFDAATSHAWNLGVGATCGSGAMEMWNRGDWSNGCRRIYISDGGRPVWSYAWTGKYVNGRKQMKFVQGLANRRQAEYRYCIGVA